MKQILFTVIMLFGYAYGQSCETFDTVRSNSASLITANSVRINGSISHIPSGQIISIQLKYVRIGYTDTVTNSGLTPLRNITGLQGSTAYYYYYKNICASNAVSQTAGAYYFTTLSNQIVYADERPTRFHYAYVDSLLQIGVVDTSLYRAPEHPSIVYKGSDDTYYAYHLDCACWQPLAIDSAGIIAMLDGKVDSVTVSGDSLFYWKVGVSYGYILPSVATVWKTTGNTGTGNFIGSNDAEDFVIKTNNTERAIIPAAGITRQVTTGLYKYMVYDTTNHYWGYSDGATTLPISSLTAATATNSIDNASYQQSWLWTGLSQYGLTLDATTTAAINGSVLFNAQVSGAHAAAGRTTSAGTFVNLHSGASSINYGLNTRASGATFNRAINASADGAGTNYALYAAASGGTTNYGLYVAAGDVNLQPQTASRFVTLDANKNIITSAVASSILAASLSDEVGTDKVVFNTSPSFVTSVIGGASFDAFNTVSTTLNIGGAATTFALGGVPTTALTANIFTNATAAATTKTINLGTGGAASSTTNINIGTAVGGTTALNSTIITLGGGTTASDLRFLEPSGSGANYTAFKAQAQAGNITYTLPNADASGLLTSDGSGSLSWTSASSLSYWPLTGTGSLLADVLITGAGSSNINISSGASGFVTDFSSSLTKVGDVNGTGSGTLITVDDANQNTIIHRGVQFDSFGAGAWTLDAGGNGSSVSDERLKKNIKPFAAGLNEVMKVNPIEFQYNSIQKHDTVGVYGGFSAQNVKANIPYSTGQNKDGYLTLQDRALLAAAYNAIKELKMLNDAQQKDIDKLKQQIKNK